MATIKIDDLKIETTENELATLEQAENVKGGYELKNVIISSYSVSGSGAGASAGFRGGVRVATGDVNGDG